MSAFKDMPREEKCYIVFRGKPTAWYIHDGDGSTAFENAEQEAAQKALANEEEYTVLCIPRESLELGIVARYQGVVLDALKKEDIG